jgi:hypothetical protein
MLRFKLRIQDLESRHPGVTTGVAMGYREAAEVCLDRHHEPPTDVTVDRGKQINAVADWQVPDERTKRAWANEIDTTEAGAYCVALAAIELTDNLVAVRRAETHTGADYYVAPKGASPIDLEDAFRLEVSGMDEGTPSLAKTLDAGQDIPAPSHIEALRAAHPEYGGLRWALVKVDPATLDDALERVNISLPRRVLHRPDARARSAGETRSGFIARMAVEARDAALN